MTILNARGEHMETVYHLVLLNDWWKAARVRQVLNARGRSVCYTVKGEQVVVDPERTLQEWLGDRIVRRAIAGHLAKTRGLSRAEAMTELRGLLAS